MRVFSALIQVLASQLLASKLGGVAMVTLRHGFPEILPGPAMLIAGGEGDSPINISRPSKIGCSVPAAGCGDSQHLGGREGRRTGLGG